jgi:hypothetical protein
MRKLIPIVATLLVTVAMTVTVFAAGASTGKVTKVEGEKVTVTLEGAVPAWAKKGATVSALGGAPKVLAVTGKEVTLKFNKAKAAAIKLDSKVSMTKGGEMQGC